MELRASVLLLLLLLLLHGSDQQNHKEATKDATIEDLQKQINDIVQELNLLKEQQALQTVCLKGLKSHNKCFLVDAVKKKYHEASEDCNAMGGVLAAPRSQSENLHLQEYVLQSLGPEQQLWLGYNDMVSEGVWTDQTGARTSYSNWDQSNRRAPQPDGGVSQNCAVQDPSGKWSDQNCGEEKVSVCQFNIV